MRLVVCLPLLLGLNGCVPFMQTVYTSVAPNALRQIIVQEYGCSSDCAVRIVLKEKWRSETIASGDDCSVKFAHAAWKGSLVSVFVDGAWCGKIRVAYDTATGKHVDFASTEDWLCRDIVSAYQITAPELAKKDGGVLFWVSQNGYEVPRDAASEFYTRHRKRPRQ
jgi:hypothetical protein